MNPWEVYDLSRESYEDGVSYENKPVDVQSVLDYRNKAEYYANLSRELVQENDELRERYHAAVKESATIRQEMINAVNKATLALVEQVNALSRERDRLVDRNELLLIRIQNLENLNG